MTIEVEAERLDQAREKAVRKLSPRAKVPGFRPGKAPPNLVRQYFGEERILDEALDALVPIVYREALQTEESVDPIAHPRFVIQTTEPLVLKATIPVRPTVELGDYAAIRVEHEEIVVEEERVDQTLDTIRRRSATLEPVEREIGWRDVVRMNVTGVVEGDTMIEPQEAEIQLVEDRDVLFPGFEEQVIGHKKGDQFEFDLDVPDEARAAQFAGKTCHFTVTIIETKEEVLPELDDEFAKQVGEGFETVEALRERIRNDIRATLREQLDQKYHDEILAELVERSTIEFPPVLLDAEIDRIMHDQAGHIEQGRGLEQYLAAVGKTEEEMREELRPIADARLRRSLVLSRVTEAEDIGATDEDVETELDMLTASAGAQAQQLRALFNNAEGRATIRRNLLTRRTLSRLVELATQDGEVTAEVEQPARKRKRKSSAAETASAEDAAPAGAAVIEEAAAAEPSGEESPAE